MQLLNRGMNMKNNRKNKINPKYVLAALSLLCIAGIGLSLFRGFSMPAAGTIVNSLMAPMQEGINSFGNFTAGIVQRKHKTTQLQNENEELNNEVDKLQAKLTAMENNLSDYEDLLDLLAPGFAIGQSIGRWGNFFNGEAHGPETTREVLEGIKIIPKFVIDGMNIAGTYYQPTFYYEFLWCLLGFVILLCVRKFYEYLKVGQLTGIYLMWYGIGRFFVESLRTDSLMLKEFKVAQIVSVIMFVVGLIMLILGFKGSKFENRYDDYEIEDIKF